jgi:PI-3-kinase-related kinase SMG-1
VEVVVTELRRMTQLWDELWLTVLTQHQSEVHRRLGHLETEIRKVHANASLSHADKELIIRKKHNTVLKPVSYRSWGSG